METGSCGWAGGSVVFREPDTQGVHMLPPVAQWLQWQPPPHPPALGGGRLGAELTSDERPGEPRSRQNQETPAGSARDGPGVADALRHFQLAAPCSRCFRLVSSAEDSATP